MNKISLFLTGLVMLLNGCVTAPQKADDTVIINDYPTRDRVEYVFNCIARHGGLSGTKAYINQYACGCKIDKIAEKLSFEEYESARTFSYLKSTPGENGAVFRDPEHAKDLRTRLKAADEYAESQCFVM